MKIRYVGGPMDGEFHEGKLITPKISVPFMTDREYVNQYGEIRRHFDMLTYELKIWKNDCGEEEKVYVLVEDEFYQEFLKFEANPALVGAKWYGA